MSLLRIASFVLSITLFSVISGCKKDTAPTAPQPGPGGTSGTTVSPAQRKAAFDVVSQVDSTIDWTNELTAKQQLVQLLQSRSEFEASGANSDASVWGRFTDGRLLIIAHNRPADDTAGAAADAAWLSTFPDIAGGEIPMNKNVTLMMSLGTLFTNTPAVIAPMFTAKGYNVTESSGSIKDLKAVNNVAAFYMSGHGGVGTLRDGSTAYGIWTSDKFDTASDAGLKQLWDNGELVYFTAEQDRVPWYRRGRGTLETHFGITAKFVTSEMSFGQNSLIYFNSCSSASPSAATFMTACLDKSVGTSAAYAGWTNTTTDRSASTTAYFMFDRLLGTNMDPRNKENPPQRPFNYAQVVSELLLKNLGIAVTDDGVALFTISPPTASFGMFAPSIEKLSVAEEKHELDVYGLFGSDLAGAQVTLNDQPVTIKNASPGQIVCSLDPSTQNTGGEVKVIVHGDTSNIVRLTEWLGKVQVTTSFPGPIGFTLTYTFHIRGDVHSFRTVAGGQVNPEVLVGSSAMPDSRADVTAGGVMIDNFTPIGGGCPLKITERWPNVRDSVTSKTGPPKSLAIAADIRPQAGNLSLYLGVGIPNLLIDSLSDSMFCPNSDPQGGSSAAPYWFNAYDTLEFHLSSTFDLIDPGPKQHPIASLEVYSFDGNLPFGTLTLTFLGATTKYPPDPKAGQRPVHRNRQGNGLFSQHAKMYRSHAGAKH